MAARAGHALAHALQDGIAATLIGDGAAAHLMKTGAVQWVIVGADRICANGDTANKIGTYSHAIAARHHGLKVMVVAPSSTVDMATARGEDIEIEMRDPAELLSVAGTRTVAEGVAAWNPAFDVTPAGLIDAIVTEKGDTGCVASGTAKATDPCDEERCAAGLTCLGSYGDRRCYKLCRVEGSDCAAGKTCATGAVFQDTSFGVCKEKTPSP